MSGTVFGISRRAVLALATCVALGVALATVNLPYASECVVVLILLWDRQS